MATPFDHLPKFQRLPDEAKTKILEKFGQKSEAEQMQIMGKIGTPMSVQDQNPGLQSVEPVTDTLKKGLESYKEQAPTLTEGLTEAGFNPKLAQVAGKVFAHVPDIAAGAKGVAEVGPSLVKGAVKMGKAVKSGFTGVKDALKGTGEKQVMRLSEEIAELPIKQTAKQEAALVVKKASHQGIQAAEESAGIGLKNVPSSGIRAATKNPERIAKFADKMDRLTRNGGAALDNASPKVLSNMREFMKAALRDKTLPQDVSIKFKAAQKVVNDKIAKQVPEVGQALGKFKEITQVLETMPAQFKKEKQLLQLALKKAQNLAKTQQGIRTGAKWASVGGATGAGAAIAKKFLGS